MEQPLNLALPSLESISPPEVSSQCKRNDKKGDPEAVNMMSTPRPVFSTQQCSKTEIPQVVEDIGAVVNMVAGCCCGPSPVRFENRPKEKQALSQRPCGCGMAEAQKSSGNVVKTTDCCMVEIKATTGSQAMPNGGNALDPDC